LRGHKLFKIMRTKSLIGTSFITHRKMGHVILPTSAPLNGKKDP
jgi:hypothetical protein